MLSGLRFLAMEDRAVERLEVQMLLLILPQVLAVPCIVAHIRSYSALREPLE